MPQHILLYTDAPEIGAVAQSNHAILLGLIDRGYQVTCVQSSSGSSLIQQQRALGIRHEWLSFDPVEEFDRNLTDIQAAAALLQRVGPDLIFFSDRCPLSNFAAKQSVLHFGAPYAIAVGVVSPDLADRFSSYLPTLSQQFAQSQAVIVVSQADLDLLHEQFWLPPDQGQVIPLSPEARMVQETLNLIERGLRSHTKGGAVKIPLPPVMQEVMELHPLVSVVIPCYQQAHFLPEAIASIIAQTYENWEIIVVNDGSPDQTSEVARQLMAVYPQSKIKLIEQINGGLPNARNVGIAAAQGEYILPLDADDKLHSEALMNLLMLSVEAAAPCVAFGSYRTFGNAHETLISVDHYSIDRIKEFDMLQVASLYPKSVWQAVQGYKEDERIAGYEDWEFWLNCHEHQIPFVGTREIVVYYRRAEGSMALKSYQKHDQLYAQMVCYHAELFGMDAVKTAENLLQAFERLNPIGIFSTQHLEKLAQYQQLSDAPSYLDQLRQARQQIAEHWLSLTIDRLEAMYTSTLGQLHQILLNSGLKSQPLTRSEQMYVDDININLSKPSDPLQTASNLLAAMLYLYPYQLPQIDLTLLPHWLLSGYLEFIFTSPGSEGASAQALELTLNQQTAAIRHSFKLRQTNLIVFPDWSQPEEQLFSSLVELLSGVITHVDRNQITLLIDTSNDDEAEADFAISSVIMNLLVEAELELDETGPEISLVGQLKKAQWQVLLSQISARLPLETENERAIASTGASNLPLQQL